MGPEADHEVDGFPEVAVGMKQEPHQVVAGGGLGDPLAHADDLAGGQAPVHADDVVAQGAEPRGGGRVTRGGHLFPQRGAVIDKEGEAESLGRAAR